MQFYVHHNGQQTGPYSREQVRSLLLSGTFRPSDLAWREGARDWAALTSYPEIVGPTASFASDPSTGFAGPTGDANFTGTSGLATSSSILGIFSFFTLGLTGIPAVICGHAALSQIKRSAGRISGNGLAITGLVTGYIGSVVVVIAIAAIFAGVAAPVIASTRDRAKAVRCLSQAKQIAVACRAYAADHKGNYPKDLDELIPGYLKDRHLFACPMTKDQSSLGYEYFGGRDTDLGSRILLVSKVTTKDRKRIVVTANGAAVMRRD